MTPPAMGFSHGWLFLLTEARMNKQTQWQRLIDDEWDAPSYEKLHNKPTRTAPHEPEHPRRVHDPREEEFRCINCKRYIPTSRESSGVNNRNHCPWCLFSRHVDLKTPGDRLAECHSKMAPIGLTLKHTPKKYGRSIQGELMLIHHCLGCGKISINRIAGDDDPHALYRLFSNSAGLTSDVCRLLKEQEIIPLDSGNRTIVFSQLFGWQAIVDELADTNKIKIPITQEKC
jgi:DNA-directed RNA polymerase subunit RPC12/RpoP